MCVLYNVIANACVATNTRTHAHTQTLHSFGLIIWCCSSLTLDIFHLSPYVLCERNMVKCLVRECFSIADSCFLRGVRVCALLKHFFPIHSVENGFLDVVLLCLLPFSRPLHQNSWHAWLFDSLSVYVYMFCSQFTSVSRSFCCLLLLIRYTPYACV